MEASTETNEAAAEKLEKTEEAKSQKGDSSNPNLYDECLETWQVSAMVFFLSKMRNMARRYELFSDWDEVIIYPAKTHTISKRKASDDSLEGELLKSASKRKKKKSQPILADEVSLEVIFDTMTSCYDAIKEVEGSLPDGSDCIDFHIQIVESIRQRCGDDGFKVLYFDDTGEDEEIVPVIVVDKHRQKVIVAFRGRSRNDWDVNVSLFKKRVKNPLYAMKQDKKALRQSLSEKSLITSKKLNSQPKTILMHDEFYDALFDFDSKVGDETKYSHILKKTLEVLEEYAGYKLEVTGLSLGGALCQVFASHLATETHRLIIKPVTCIAFASPKVGSMAFNGVVQCLEELGYLRLLRVENNCDPVPSLPREINTLCCFTGLSTLSLIFNQSRLYRKVGMGILLKENGIEFTYPKVPPQNSTYNFFRSDLFAYDMNAMVKKQSKCCSFCFNMLTFDADLSKIHDQHSYPTYFQLIHKHKEAMEKVTLEGIYSSFLLLKEI